MYQVLSVIYIHYIHSSNKESYNHYPFYWWKELTLLTISPGCIYTPHTQKWIHHFLCSLLSLLPTSSQWMVQYLPTVQAETWALSWPDLLRATWAYPRLSVGTTILVIPSSSFVCIILNASSSLVLAPPILKELCIISLYFQIPSQYLHILYVYT